MNIFIDLLSELIDVLSTILYAIPYIAAYVLLIVLSLFLWQFFGRQLSSKKDLGSLKTVTFGDASAVSSNGVASLVSICLLYTSPSPRD